MKVRDELLRAAVYAAIDVRDNGGDLRAAVAEIITVHRVAPLAEYAVELRLARRAVLLADAAYEARRWERVWMVA